MMYIRSRNQLQNFLTHTNAGHAFMFQYDATGKAAHDTARMLLCTESREADCTCYSCKAFDRGIHTELHSISGSDTIDDLRAVIAKGSATISTSSRVTLITDAHLLSHEASSALLKCLEEPIRGHSFVISSQLGTRLKTLQSRSICFACGDEYADVHSLGIDIHTAYLRNVEHGNFLHRFETFQKSGMIKLSTNTQNNLLIIAYENA